MSRGVRVAAGMVVLLAVVGGFFAWRWWSHPDVLSSYGNGVGMDQKPSYQAPFSSPLGFPEPPRETITIRSAHPRITRNTADAKVQIVICTPNKRRVPGSDLPYDAIPLGGHGIRLSDYCSSVRPLSSAEGLTRMTWGRDYFVAVITPHRRGRTSVAGVDVEYSRGPRHLWQTGTQRTGFHLSARTR